MRRAGFTLLEMVLASSIAAMVIVVVTSMFFALERAEKTSTAVFERTSEFATTQVALRRAFQRLAMASSDDSDNENRTAVLEPRPRMVLEHDAGAGVEGVMRFEVVVSKPPVSQLLAGPAAKWAFADADAASLNYLSPDGSGGQTRGVFEIRPDGARERVMTQLGIPNPLWGTEEITPASAARTDEHRGGWTLWWRRISGDEVLAMADGAPIRPDNPAGGEAEAKRLAGSVRLARGLTMIEWSVFKGDQWVRTFRAMAVRDLPAYIKLRVRTAEGTFAEWLFEVDWTTVDTVVADQEALQLALADLAAQGIDPNGAGANGGIDPDLDQPDDAEPGSGQGRGSNRKKIIQLNNRRRDQ